MSHSFYQQGLSKANLKDYKGAIIAFTQDLKYQPSAEAYYKRGQAYFNLKSYQKAIDDYDDALKIVEIRREPKPTWYFARGLAKLELKKFEFAISDAKQAIVLKPDYAAAYNLIGTARRQQGYPQKARPSYIKAANLYKEQYNVSSCKLCIRCIRELSHKPQSFPESTQTSSSSSNPLIDPIKFLEQAVDKDYRDAMDDLNWVLQVDPENARAYVSRGYVQADKGDLKNAVKDYETAEKLFEQQGHKEMAQLMQDIIQIRQKELGESITIADRFERAVIDMEESKDNAIRQDLKKLMRQFIRHLTGPDQMTFRRLVDQLKRRNPGMPEDWYLEKAMYRFKRNH